MLEAHQAENHTTVGWTKGKPGFPPKKLIGCRQVEKPSMLQRILHGKPHWWKQKSPPQEIDSTCDRLPGLHPF